MKLVHVPAAITTAPQLIEPRDVTTPVMRSFSIFTDSTFVAGLIETPSLTTLLVSAWLYASPEHF